MIIWLDAQLSPYLALWLQHHFPITVTAVRDLNLREATDEEIFSAARSAGAVVMTKDQDFVKLVERLGPPPQIIWITCGNTSNQRLRQVLSATLPDALRLLQAGDRLVEISDLP